MDDGLERITAAFTDPYAVEREFGAGGMATVYLARDVKHDRHVALKILKPALAKAFLCGGSRGVGAKRRRAGASAPEPRRG